MRVPFVLAVGAGLFAGLLCSTWQAPRLAQSQESKKETKPAPAATKPHAQPHASDTHEKLAGSAKAFETAFNKQDAAAIADQFAENAEVIDEDGNVVEGRDNIKTRFEEIFQDHPKAKIAVEMTSLRELSPDVAVEDGFSVTTLNPDEPASRSPYAIVHVKRDGKWVIGSVRDFPEESLPSAHDHLMPLAWLVGDWVDQTDDAKVATSCKWSEDGNYLIQEYVLKLRGGVESRGTQRIGWDPLRKTIRSWAFDHSGGFGEAIWTPVDDTWVIKADGVTPDGKPASVTRILTQLDTDLFELEITNRLVGHELLPDTTVRVVRRPPAPVDQ